MSAGAGDGREVDAGGQALLVAEALRALGTAYRGDWHDFDGRTLRSELEVLASFLDGSETTPMSLDAWYVGENICPENKCWAEHCLNRTAETPRYCCAHLDHIWTLPVGASLVVAPKKATDG